MSKFNPDRIKAYLTHNFEDGEAFIPDAKTELLLRSATALMGEDKFYTDAEKTDSDFRASVRKVLTTDPAFVLKLALFCRKDLHLRSVPLVLLAEYANSSAAGSVPAAKIFVSSVIRRADEITEILALQLKYSGELNRKTRLPMVIRRGVAGAFHSFDEYQFAKYKKTGSTVTLRDALRLCRPRPETPEEEMLFRKIATGTLGPALTWEFIISRDGSNKDAWEAVIPKMGIMALIRNLRNFIRHDVDIEPVVKKLTSPDVIRHSQILPFRFYSARNALMCMPSDRLSSDQTAKIEALQNALESATVMSIDNIPVMGGRTLVAVDVSESMKSNVSGNSRMRAIDIATLFGALSKKVFGNATISAFASEFTLVPLPSDNVLQNAENIRFYGSYLGGATYGHKIFEWLIDHRESFDRIVILSDMQTYCDTSCEVYQANSNYQVRSVSDLAREYRRDINPEVTIYSVDLMGYGTVMFQPNVKKTVQIAGWSEAVFRFIDLYERDTQTMIDVIKSIVPDTRDSTGKQMDDDAGNGE